MELCRFLRWKGFYGKDWVGAEGLAEALRADEVQYSCLKTCEPWGPDDGVATPGTCGGHRSCYRLSPITPPLNV